MQGEVGKDFRGTLGMVRLAVEPTWSCYFILLTERKARHG